MESVYQMDPYNVTSDLNIAMNIQHAAADLHDIQSDVHYMRQSIWSNQFLNFFTGYGAGASVMYQPDFALDERISRLETNQRIKDSSTELLNAWKQILDLCQTTYGRTSEIDNLVLELKKLGPWFVGEMGWQEFMAQLAAELEDFEDKAKLVTSKLKPIVGSEMEIEDQIDYVQDQIQPIIEGVSSRLATLDFKAEIAVHILKACIGLKRLENRKIELYKESEKTIKELESGTLELPFNVDLLNRSLNLTTAEVNEMRALGKECKETSLLLGDDYEEMAAWINKLEYRVQVIQETITESIAKLQDLKRIYELYWFKNH
jgi:chromosome segregation ATPase